MKDLQNTNFVKGFTLVELIVAIFGFSLIAYGIIFLMSNIFTSTSGQTNILADTDQARKLAFQIVSELRNSNNGSDGGYPLNTAQDQQIVFYSNIDTDVYPERIRYYVQSGKLYKGVTDWNGSAYNTATEQKTVVQNNLANGTSPVFYYYNDTYIGSSTQVSLTQPVNLLQVKYIKVNLQIYNVAGVSKTNTYTVSSSAAFRNLKTNLGN